MIISGLTIHKGSAIGPFFGIGAGGGIANAGNLTLNNCVVSDNKARGGQNRLAALSGGMPTAAASSTVGH